MIIPGQPVRAVTDNNAFISRTSDSSTVGKITLQNPSSDTITDTQKYINEIAVAAGVDGESDALVNDYATNNYITDGQNRKAAIESLDLNLKAKNDQTDIYITDLFDEVTLINGKFNGATGHTHDGTTGNGPKISAANIDGVKLKGYFVKGTDISSIIAMGSSKDISALMTGKTASTGSTVKGVVVDAPYNKIFIQNGFGDKVVDDAGNEVYGRLTYSSPTWTLSFYVNIAGTETAYSFTTSANISWFYQELFNPIADDMVYSEFANIPSENATEDVLPSSETVAGKVFLANTAPPTIASTAAKGTSTRAAKEDHTHDGVTSVNGNKGAVSLTSTDVGLANVTNDAQLKRAGNDYSAITEKTTVAANDLVLIEDSAASFVKKKVKMSNMGGGSGSGVASWLTATAYTVGQVVTYNRQLFLCLTAHTAGASFETDLVTNTYWVLTSKQDNYMQVGSTFESGTANGWNDLSITGYTAGTFPPNNLTIGSAAAVDTSTPISGIASLKNTTATTWTAGTGLVSPKVTIDKAVLGKVVTINFDYWISAGSSNMSLTGTSTNTYHVVIWDAANAAWIQPTNTYGISSIGPASWQGTFQVPTNATYFYVGLLVANANTSGTTTILFDNFAFSRKIAPTGPTITDWQQYTMTVGGTTTAPTKGTTTIDKAEWRREGDSMRIRYDYKQTALGSGAAGSGQYLFTLPSGYSIDLAKIPAASTESHVVGAAYGFTTATNEFLGYVSAYSSTALAIYGTNETSRYTFASSSATFANAAVQASFEAVVPIQGWSSNVQLSSDAGNSRYVFSANKVGGTFTAATNVSGFTNILKNDGSAWNNTSGEYTVQSPGDFKVELSFEAATSNNVSRIYRTRSGSTTALFTGDGYAANGFHGVRGLVTDCIAGDIITIKPTSTATLGGAAEDNTISIYKLSSPQTIAASDTIAASYYLSANQTTAVQINFDSKEFDYTGMVTTGVGTWKAQPGIPGLYDVTVRIISGANSFRAYIYKNNVKYTEIALFQLSPNVSFATTKKIRLLATDFIDIRPNASTAFSGGALDADNTSQISITKVGNY